MKAVIPAAGLGTRFLPYTRSQPKEMLPVVDKPAIQYVVEEAVASGIDEILIVTARGKRAIEDHFDRNPDLEHHRESIGATVTGDIQEILDRTRIYYVRQTEHRGLGHAVLLAKEFVRDEPFSLLLGDDLTFDRVPCQRVLLDIQSRKGASVLAVQGVDPGSIGRYGMVVGEEVGSDLIRVTDIVEKPVASQVRSTLATIGRYAFAPSIFDHLAKTSPDTRGELQLTDAILGLLKTEDVYAYTFKGRRYDVGDKVGWLQANLELALERPDMAKEVRQFLDQKGPWHGS